MLHSSILNTSKPGFTDVHEASKLSKFSDAMHVDFVSPELVCKSDLSRQQATLLCPLHRAVDVSTANLGRCHINDTRHHVELRVCHSAHPDKQQSLRRCTRGVAGTPWQAQQAASPDTCTCCPCCPRNTRGGFAKSRLEVRLLAASF